MEGNHTDPFVAQHSARNSPLINIIGSVSNLGTDSNCEQWSPIMIHDGRAFAFTVTTGIEFRPFQAVWSGPDCAIEETKFTAT